jgi:SAM-dependent methyltransferase
LWGENCDRIPSGWKATLSDFSPGMLADCQANLASCGHQFAYEIIDAQRIPRPDASLDAVIANHMLYHVPDRQQALIEIRRVLKPGGLIFASTVGESHMQELDDLAHRVIPDWKTNGLVFAIDFTLENGAGELAGWFEDIRLERYEDSLLVSEAEPIVAYVFSGRRSHMGAERRADFLRYVEKEIHRSGAIRISKDSGMFIARKAVA